MLVVILKILKVLTFNLANTQSELKIQVLQQFLNHRDVHVTCFQETEIQSLKLSKYNIYSSHIFKQTKLPEV